MRLIDITHRTRSHGHFTRSVTDYCFRNSEREYKVEETGFESGRRMFSAFVYFYRTTSNVFGNGSTDVSQSGWRRLPNGPKSRELRGMAEALSIRSRVAVSQTP